MKKVVLAIERASYPIIVFSPVLCIGLCCSCAVRGSGASRYHHHTFYPKCSIILLFKPPFGNQNNVWFGRCAPTVPQTEDCQVTSLQFSSLGTLSNLFGSNIQDLDSSEKCASRKYAGPAVHSSGWAVQGPAQIQQTQCFALGEIQHAYVCASKANADLPTVLQVSTRINGRIRHRASKKNNNVWESYLI
jgi:hypothetical protein